MGSARQQGLVVDQAQVWFGALHVLGPVSFEIASGQCVVLLGPSGCGKSTLLAAVAGLQALKAGVIKNASNADQPGLVFQSPNLMPWASATSNVALPLILSGMDTKAAHVRANAALTTVGLADFADAKPRALSGGMAMRVALARALVTDPKTLLLDEPFAAIDELGRRDLNDLVLGIKAARNISILFVTHSVEEAVYMGDRIMVLSQRPGTIVADIAVPSHARNPEFLLSADFSDTVKAARSALAQSMRPS